MQAIDVLILELVSQTGQDIRLSYLASPNQTKVEYIGWAPIDAPVDGSHWKLSKIIYNANICEERILTSTEQVKWDDRVSYFFNKYGV